MEEFGTTPNSKMTKKCEFYENVKTWLRVCKWLGMFPYDTGDFRKMKYSKIYVSCSFSVLLLCEIAYCGLKYLMRIHNFLFFGAEVALMVLWLTFWVRKNEILIEIFRALDRHDELHRKLTGVTLVRKKMFGCSEVKVVTFLFFFDFVTAVYLIFVWQNDDFLVAHLLFAVVRQIERRFFFLFSLLYLYLIYCLRSNFEQLHEWWHESVETKLDRLILYRTLNVKVKNLRILYNHLIDIVQLLNGCFGSRFIILFSQLFFLILMYFFWICIGWLYITYLLPFYLAVFLYCTLSTQALLNSVKYNTRAVLKLALFFSRRTCNATYRNSDKARVFCSVLPKLYVSFPR